MFEGNVVYENWIKWYNEELKQLFGDLDIVLSFVRISRLDWIGYLTEWILKGKFVRYLTINLRQVE
jgi:hypothetical protein